MRDCRMCLLIGLAICVSFGFGCGKSNSAAPSVGDEQKKAEVSKQAEMNFREGQIKQSNLSPEEKQRLIDQLHAQSGK